MTDDNLRSNIERAIYLTLHGFWKEEKNRTHQMIRVKYQGNRYKMMYPLVEYSDQCTRCVENYSIVCANNNFIQTALENEGRSERPWLVQHLLGKSV